MKFSGIYAITDDALLPAEQLLHKVELALRAGIALLQYRSKTATRESKQHIASELALLCASYQVPLLINDDPQLALESGAQGVHLGQSDGDIKATRKLLGSDAIIGVTCHASLEKAQIAEAVGADYVAFGRFFPSSTKPEAPPAELTLLGEAKQKLTLPIVAIGGINPENGASAIAAGADMLAVIHSLFGESDVSANAARLVSLFRNNQ
ncbi:MAG: thiamine phosphate synthase [Proteobacteria bacterium]|jgi:thiamine-phosphate pyrophosphorylase|nr:thiamine phosphate synthase [Pseudomonadota bacterium]MDA0928713.1 thiamine phosphate synthase [Pseudomonadota bacterium]